MSTPGHDAEHIFGEIDAQKLRSSMTLFLRAAPDERLFQHVLDQYFDGLPDVATDQRRLIPAEPEALGPPLGTATDGRIEQGGC